MTPERFQRISKILSARQPDLSVVMEDVHKPHNLAAIVRSCDAVGALYVHAVAGSEKIQLSQHAASGSLKWVDIKFHDDMASVMATLGSEGVRRLALTIDENAVDYREIDYTVPTALIVGSELHGLSESAVEQSDASVYIPMLGMVDSLNVSVATALVLFEARRQREAAGAYDVSRLDPEEYRTRLFEWTQPVVAEYCRRHGFDYPELDDDGELVGPLPRR